MTEKPGFLEPDVVLFMHDQALREYGETQGDKSKDLLRTALARSENRWHYAENEELDMTILVAAYAYGIACNHHFIKTLKNGLFFSLKWTDQIIGAARTIFPKGKLYDAMPYLAHI